LVVPNEGGDVDVVLILLVHRHPTIPQMLHPETLSSVIHLLVPTSLVPGGGGVAESEHLLDGEVDISHRSWDDLEVVTEKDGSTSKSTTITNQPTK